MNNGLLRKIDAVTIQVPDLDTGLAFYSETLGHELRWRNDSVGQAGLRVPDRDTEIVLTTEHVDEPNSLVESADDVLVLVDLTKGRYTTDDTGHVTQVVSDS